MNKRKLVLSLLPLFLLSSCNVSKGNDNTNETTIGKVNVFADDGITLTKTKTEGSFVTYTYVLSEGREIASISVIDTNGTKIEYIHDENAKTITFAVASLDVSLTVATNDISGVTDSDYLAIQELGQRKTVGFSQKSDFISLEYDNIVYADDDYAEHCYYLNGKKYNFFRHHKTANGGTEEKYLSIDNTIASSIDEEDTFAASNSMFDHNPFAAPIRYTESNLSLLQNLKSRFSPTVNEKDNTITFKALDPEDIQGATIDYLTPMAGYFFCYGNPINEYAVTLGSEDFEIVVSKTTHSVIAASFSMTTSIVGTSYKGTTTVTLKDPSLIDSSYAPLKEIKVASETSGAGFDEYKKSGNLISNLKDGNFTLSVKGNNVSKTGNLTSETKDLYNATIYSDLKTSGNVYSESAYQRGLNTYDSYVGIKDGSRIGMAGIKNNESSLKATSLSDDIFPPYASSFIPDFSSFGSAFFKKDSAKEVYTADFASNEYSSLSMSEQILTEVTSPFDFVTGFDPNPDERSGKMSGFYATYHNLETSKLVFDFSSDGKVIIDVYLRNIDNLTGKEYEPHFTYTYSDIGSTTIPESATDKIAAAKAELELD